MGVLTVEILYSVLLAIAAALGMVQSGAMTDHAQTAHVTEAVNAASMIETIEAELNGKGPCDILQVHFCWYHNGAGSPHAKVVCYQNGRDLADGLIIGLGKDSPCVVTGFTARRDYWFGSVFRDKCMVLDVSVLRGWMRMMYPGILH